MDKYKVTLIFKDYNLSLNDIIIKALKIKLQNSASINLEYE